MRLWHYELIPYLPKKQLMGQWRELSAIAGKIEKHGTPQHLLVDKVMLYPKADLHAYTYKVYRALIVRGVNVKVDTLVKIRNLDESLFPESDGNLKIFSGWHDTQYLKQCYYNLQEKHNCAGLSDKEWDIFYTGYLNVLFSPVSNMNSKEG